jgi:AcrR family transcriptional regulator
VSGNEFPQIKAFTPDPEADPLNVKDECAHCFIDSAGGRGHPGNLSSLIFNMKRKTGGAQARATRGKRVKNKENTRKAILRAALELFAEKGFYQTTTKAISRKAGIAEGTLFNYFETKEDLALFFFEQELVEIIEWYERDRRMKRAALAEKLFAIIHQFLERLAPYEEFIGAVYLRALAPASKLSPWSLQTQERNLRYLRFIRGILAEAEAAGELPSVGDFGAYAFGLFHLAIITYWLRDRSRGKEQTLALLDRCLKLGAHVLRKGGWDW